MSIRTKIMGSVAILAAIMSVNVASADITLTSGNSSTTIQTSSSAGQSSWTIDGVNQVFQQWFWFRTSPTGGQAAINTLSAPQNEFASGNVGGVTYSAGGLTISVTFILTGGSNGSGTADVAEIISIHNAAGLSGFSFFQYVDFDLGGTAGDDSVSFTNANTVVQSDASGAWVAETAAVPTPNRHEAGLFPSLRNNIDSASTYNLNGNNSAGPGDVAWAFQWDATGTDLIISKDKHIQIPAPGAALLGWMGLALAGWMKRRIG